MGIFIIDQLFHIFILWAIIKLSYQHIYPHYFIIIANELLAIKFILAMLICGRPAAYFVDKVLKCIKKTDEKSEDSPSNGSGRIIGVLEREIILVLIILQQYSAIGFVITAKSFARYKNLEDKEFAEKYLVGTLASVLLSILTGVFFF